MISNLLDYNALALIIERSADRLAYTSTGMVQIIIIVYIYTIAPPYKAENLYKSILNVNFK